MRGLSWKLVFGAGVAVRIFLVCALCAGLCITQIVHAQGAKAPAIEIISQDGFNFKLLDQPSATEISLQPSIPVHNWFAGTLSNLPVDQDMTINFVLPVAKLPKEAHASVIKWLDLVPVMTYADPTKYESYEWFTKDAEGRWVSGDMFKTDDARYAGTGKVPKQAVVPAEVAEQCLTDKGSRWFPWREIVSVKAYYEKNIFTITQRFSRPQATIAMRVPFTYTYLQAFLDRLKTAKLPGVFVDETVVTPEKRKLQIIRIEDPKSTCKPEERTTFLLIAREHATEQDGSWALVGAVRALTQNTPAAAALRKDTTWLIIPIEDPDGSARAKIDGLTDRFLDSKDPALPPEVPAYAYYFTGYINNNRTIDASVSFHGYESGEGGNLACILIDPRFKSTIVAVNKDFFTRLIAAGYRVDTNPGVLQELMVNSRLYAWCALHFSTLDLLFEVNGRSPDNRLSLEKLGGIGAILAQTLAGWRDSDEGRAHHQAILNRLQKRATARAEYFKKFGYGPDKRTIFDLLMLGY